MTGKTLGGYIRTTPDPDDMDGGVAAALVEQEAERPTADDFANAEFARHPDGRTACSKLPHSGLPWIDSKGERWGSGAFARDGWSQVRECPDPAVHTQVGIVRAVPAANPCSCSAQRGRAAKAEKESARLAAILETTARQRDEADMRAARPIEVTDAMVERGRTAYWGNDCTVDERVRAILTAALTEPPTRRPEAERLDPIIDAAIRGHSDIASPTVVHAIADALAEEGVYVPEGER